MKKKETKLKELEKRIEALEKGNCCKHMPVIMPIQAPVIQQVQIACPYCGRTGGCPGHVIC